MEESWYASFIRLPLLTVAVCAVLSGCVGRDIEAMRNTKSPNEAYSNALTKEYRQITLFEADEMYDWPDAGHFARKGLNAAAGKRPSIEKVADWNVPAEHIGRLNAAREGFVTLVALGSIEAAPALTAKAQARFDCWVEQQEENHQFDHIAACRRGYFGAIADLQDALTQKHTAYFDFGKHHIRPDAESAIAQASARAVEVANLATVEVTIDGHTDTVGSETLNQELSEKRADAARDAMVAKGAPDTSITTNGFGFSQLSVLTPPGVREQRNRRSEITVKPIVLVDPRQMAETESE